MKLKLKYFIAAMSLLAILLPGIASAADYVEYPSGWEIVPKECLDAFGDCNINSFVQLFVNLAGIMMKVAPTLALVAFVVGGVFFIGSGGNQTRLETGKKILSSTVIGVLLIIGVGWLMSFFIVAALTGDTKQTAGKIFSGPWQQDWWTAKSTDTEATPISPGCCFIDNLGCQSNVSQSDCNNIKNSYTPYLPVGENLDDRTFWNTEFPNCLELTQCLNLQGITNCCIPRLISDTTCYKPKHDDIGCLSWPNTVSNILDCTAFGPPNGQCLIIQ